MDETLQKVLEFIRPGDQLVCEYANPAQVEDNFAGTVVEVTAEGFTLADGDGLRFSDLSADFAPADGVATFLTKDGAIDVYHLQ